VIFSFEKQISFVKKWRWVWPAVFTTLLIFVVWDHFFTIWGVWGFNDAYITGWKIWQLPVEEILFFVTIPFACLFVYEVFNFLIKRDILKHLARPLGILAIAVCMWLVFTFPDRLYTSVSSLFAITLLMWHHVFFPKPWLGRFWVAYIVCIIPFFLVNGILTSLPVVTYNNEFNLGIRLYTIPVEDLIYQLDLLLLNVTLYEKQKTYQRA
jgi:lycopene cyclase domain-containing protein